MIYSFLNCFRAAVALLFLLPLFSPAQSRRGNGLQIFITNCATCHRSNSGTRAPLPEVLQQMPREAIVRALETGLMKQQGASLSAEEKNAVASYLSRAHPVEPITKGLLSREFRAFHKHRIALERMVPALDNARFQTADHAGLNREQVTKLKLKWAFGFPEGGSAAQPTVAGGRMFVGTRKAFMHWMRDPDACTGR